MGWGESFYMLCSRTTYLERWDMFDQEIYRIESVDKYIEGRFGKPDYSKSFIKDGMVWTPIGKWRLWRIDTVAHHYWVEKVKDV